MMRSSDDDPSISYREMEYDSPYVRERGRGRRSAVSAGRAREPIPGAPIARGLLTAAMAASVLIALGGVFWGVWSQQRLARQYSDQLATLTNQIQGLRAQLDTSQRVGPKTNLNLIELFSDASVRGEQGPKPVEVENVAGRELVFILNGQGAANATSYRIELRDRDGRLLWHSDHVRRDDTGNFMVSLPAGYLQPGQYLISLTGGNSTLTYRFDLKE